MHSLVGVGYKQPFALIRHILEQDLQAWSGIDCFSGTENQSGLQELGGRWGATWDRGHQAAEESSQTSRWLLSLFSHLSSPLSVCLQQFTDSL